MIGIKDESIIDIIETKFKDYEKILQDIMNSEEPDKELATKYQHYLFCLTELRRGLFLRENAVFETLRINYEKHDTRFIFMDDSSYTVKKDDICSFKDNYVLIYDNEEFEKDKTVYPPVMRAVNCDNVKLIETVY